MSAYLEKEKRGYLRLGEKHLPVEILACAKDTIGVSFPHPQPIENGMKLDLEFCESDRLVVYHMQVVVAPIDPGDGVILQRIKGAMYAEKRRTWRVTLDEAVGLRRRGDPRPSNARVLNLSCEGAYLETACALRVGDVVDLLLSLPELPTHQVGGKVVRVEPREPDSNGTGRYGVYFVELFPEARRTLTYFMWKRLRELYPREIAALWPGSGGRRKRAETSRRRKPGGSETGNQHENT